MADSFPGVVVRKGSTDAGLVTRIQQALRGKGYGPFNPGVFDEEMAAVVRLFQAQNADADGHALVVDAEVGLLTWTALFGITPAAIGVDASALMLQAVAVAGSQVGQMEVPVGSNRGPMVDVYLKATGVPLDGADPNSRAWCMAFVYWAFARAATSLNTANPLPRTAGCADHWARARNVADAVRLSAADALRNPALLKPGMVFIHDFGGGLGHTGIVERLLPGGRLATVEGNTNNDGSRTGVGVFRLERRKLSDATLKGFVDYTQA
jgi:hypothetical protein